MRSDVLRRTQNGNLSNTYCEESNCEEFISERQATHMRLGPPGALSMQ